MVRYGVFAENIAKFSDVKAGETFDGALLLGADAEGRPTVFRSAIILSKLSPNIQVGNVTTGAPGTSAAVTRRNGSPNTAPVFDFIIPQGPKGDKGDKGDPGEKGEKGAPGADGAQGPAGPSPYDQAVAAGYTGTQAQFDAALMALKDSPFLPLVGGILTGDLKVKGKRIYFGNANSGFVSYIDGDQDDGDLKIVGGNWITIESDDDMFLTAGGDMYLSADSEVLVTGGAVCDSVARATDTKCFRNIYAGTGAMTANSTSLTTGSIYLQYE